MKMKKIIILLAMSLLLCGCIKAVDQTPVTDVPEENVTEEVPEDVADNKIYFDEKDYEKLIYSVGELIYMSRFTPISELEQEENGEMYIMDYVFGCCAVLPINKVEPIDGDPNGIIAPPDSEVRCYTLPEEDVYWTFKNVFGWENLTISEFRNIEYLEPGLCSNYYVQDGLVYYCSEDESWVSWGEKFVAGSVLSNGDVYFKLKAYDMYNGEFDFYVLAALKETEAGDRFWCFKQADFEPISVEMQDTEVVYFEQPFDDSFEDAYVKFLWDVVTGEQTIANDKTVGGVLDRYSLRFMPVYINDDNIPELLVSDYGSHVNTAHLFSYVDGEVKNLGNYGAFGGLEYLKREGKICSSYSGMGYESYKFYEFDGKEVKEVASAGRTREGASGVTENYYHVNNVDTTAQAVEEFLEQEEYLKYEVTKYDDYYHTDLITIAAVIQKYDGVAEGTKLEWVKNGEVVPLPEKQEADTASDEQENEQAVPTADEELIRAAMAYFKKINGYDAPYAAIDHTDGDIVTIHLYDSTDDHLSTYDWYEVDRNTGVGTDILGNEIRIFE